MTAAVTSIRAADAPIGRALSRHAFSAKITAPSTMGVSSMTASICPAFRAVNASTVVL